MFRDRFEEYAAHSHVYANSQNLPFHEVREGYEHDPTFTLPAPSLCQHFPWWRLDDIPAQSYDVVTSNANLNEMTEEALKLYVHLIGKVLKRDGIIIVQCLGGGATGVVDIVQTFYRAGFRLAVMVDHSTPDEVKGIPNFATANCLIARNNHPLFEQISEPITSVPFFDRTAPLVKALYLPAPEGRRLYQKHELLTLLERRCAG